MKKKRLVGVLGIVFVALPCLLCGVGFGILNSRLSSSDVALNEEIDAAHKAGLAVFPDEIRLHPTVPENQNAGPRYQQAFQMMPKTSFASSTASKILHGTAPKADVEKAKAALAEAQPALATITQASKLPYCDFHYKYELGPSLTFREFAEANEASRCLCMRAHFELIEGHRDAAFNDLATAVRLGDHMAQIPSIIAFFVDIGIEGQTMRSLAIELGRRPSDADLKSRCASFVSSLPPTPNMRRALMGEIVSNQLAIQSLQRFRDLTGGTEPDDSSDLKVRLNLPIPEGLKRTWRIRNLRLWRQMFAVLRPNAGWKAIGEAFDVFDRQTTRDESIENLANQALMPVISYAPYSIGRQLAIRNCLLSALSILGKPLPNNCTPTGTDPFTGTPLNYQRTKDGFRIYSVGMSGQGEGGTIIRQDMRLEFKVK